MNHDALFHRATSIEKDVEERQILTQSVEKSFLIDSLNANVAIIYTVSRNSGVVLYYWIFFHKDHATVVHSMEMLSGYFAECDRSYKILYWVYHCFEYRDAWSTIASFLTVYNDLQNYFLIFSYFWFSYYFLWFFLISKIVIFIHLSLRNNCLIALLLSSNYLHLLGSLNSFYDFYAMSRDFVFFFDCSLMYLKKGLQLLLLQEKGSWYL